MYVRKMDVAMQTMWSSGLLSCVSSQAEVPALRASSVQVDAPEPLRACQTGHGTSGSTVTYGYTCGALAPIDRGWTWLLEWVFMTAPHRQCISPDSQATSACVTG